MNPSPGIPPPSDVRPFDILVVGTMNVCRSPVAEQLLLARLGEGGAVAVTSVGTSAALGLPVPEPLVELLAAAGAPVDGHTARQLDRDMVGAADLILTVTREERAEVVSHAPTALRRTFTLRELARVARLLGPSAIPDGDVAERLSALVEAAAPHRALTEPAAAAEDDIADPYGQSRRAYAESFDQVRAAVDAIAHTVGPRPDEPEAPPPPEPYRPPARRHSRARTVALALLATIVALVIAGTVGALVVLDRLEDRIQRFPDPFAGLPTRPAAPSPVAPESEQPSTEPPVTILVLGSTDDVTSGDPAQWASAAALTDVVMLAHVSADRQSAQVVVLPPDLSLDAAASTPDTLRSAFAAGGPTGAVRSVEQLTDVRVDHVALTDSATFARVTEALGGVDFDLPDDLVVNRRVVLSAGHHRLTGEQALLWVQGTGADDAGRADRAQTWLGAILHRLGDDDVRGSPTSWLQLVSVVSDSVAVDEGFDRSTMVGLLTSLRGLRPDDVGVVAAPTTVETVDGGGAVLVPDAEPFGALMDALRSDTLGEHLADAGTTG